MDFIREKVSPKSMQDTKRQTKEMLTSPENRGTSGSRATSLQSSPGYLTTCSLHAINRRHDGGSMRRRRTGDFNILN